MKFVKLLLMGLGALVVLASCFLGYVAFDSHASKGEQQTFVQAVLSDLSEDWNPDTISKHIAENLVTELRRAGSAGGFRQLSQLGRFVAAEETHIVHHLVSTAGKQTILDLMARYENGRAKVRAVIFAQGASRKLVGFHIFIDGPVTAAKIKL